MNTSDTIAAIATPPGEGGIAIVRISGPGAPEILGSLFRPAGKNKAFEHAHMLYGYAVDAEGNDIDEVMAVRFVPPRSYTREDVCEIHTHGGISAGRVLKRAVELGARPAERGEFTYRAFVNGRISLDRAEAVMSLISSVSEEAARRSLSQLKSGSSALIGQCSEKIRELLVLIDAAADFPDEIDEEVSAERVRKESAEIADTLQRIADPRYARVLTQGARVVIAGRPNVGKSSIMNRLLSWDRSIVTDIPGTTRDAVSESVTVRGVRITLTDTAGIRETGDEIEKIGVKIARDVIESADAVVLVLDSSDRPSPEEEELLRLRDSRFITVANKDDIRSRDVEGAIRISARTGEGMDRLTDEIYKKIAADEDDEKLLTLRHIEAAKQAVEALERIKDAPETEFMRQDLTDALVCLGKISGENVSEEVIDGIFERFCVGK